MILAFPQQPCTSIDRQTTGPIGPAWLPEQRSLMFLLAGVLLYMDPPYTLGYWLSKSDYQHDAAFGFASAVCTLTGECLAVTTMG